jgi:tetratricopeptide (TPR) repeat protein
LSSVVFKISAGFLAGALALLATALYLSEHYLSEETRLAAAGDLRGALGASRTAARLNPFSPIPLEGQSYLLQQQGLDEDAAGALREAIERDPNNYILYLLLGNLQVAKLDDLDAAEENYRKVLELNPNNTTASTALARVLIEKGDLEEAKEEYENLRKEKEIPYQGLYNLGRIYVRTGHPREGYETIKLARRKASAGLNTLKGPQRAQREQLVESMDLALADALVVQGDYAGAREIIAGSSSPQAPALLQLLDADPEAYRESVVESGIY